MVLMMGCSGCGGSGCRGGHFMVLIHLGGELLYIFFLTLNTLGFF